VLHLVEHLVVAVIGIDGDDAGAEGVEGQIVEEELRPVLEEQRDAVAVAVAGRGVDLTERQYGIARLSVRELDAVGMVGAAGGRRRAEKDVVGRGRGRRRERLENCLRQRCPPWVARTRP
jgi:hypothetical protein